jgi:hypothetical protein
MRLLIVHHPVRRDAKREDVIQPKRRHQLELPISIVSNPDRMRLRGKMADGFAGTRIARAGLAEFLRIPQMHPRLVADLDRQRQPFEIARRPTNDSILGLVGQVAVIEVEQVHIPDAVARRLAGQMVPDGIIESA